MTPDSFKQYLNAIGRYPLLSAEQEIQLSRQVRRYLELRDAEGERTKQEQREMRIGVRARDMIINCNLRLVVHISKRYITRLQSNNMDLMDLIQEGALGLHRAAEMFDGTKGYKFSTYAYWWIRQAITRAIDTKERLIRVPQHALEKTYAAAKAQREFAQANGRTPTAREVAEIINVKVDELLMLMERNRPHRSLDALITEDGSTVLDIIADEYGIDEDHNPEEVCERMEQLQLAFFRLDPFDRDVVRLNYGIGCNAPQSYAEIGRNLGVCRERVRQRAQRAQRKLKLILQLSLAA